MRGTGVFDMKEIKFRAKEVLTGRNTWVYGVPFGDKMIIRDNSYFSDEYGNVTNFETIEIDVETIGQFVGYSDTIPPQEIYEGDIIQAYNYAKEVNHIITIMNIRNIKHDLSKYDFINVHDNIYEMKEEKKQ